jgi:hypothetical protein
MYRNCFPAGAAPHDEVIATASNFLVAAAAYDTSVALWPNERIDLRQGTRVIRKSKEQ